MTQDELDLINGVIENEGFDYAFRYYSNFSEVKDEKFHELHVAFVKAAEALELYLEEKEQEIGEE